MLGDAFVDGACGGKRRTGDARRLVHPEEHWIVHATEAAAEVLGQFAAAQAAYNVDVRLIVDQPQVRVVGVGRWDDPDAGLIQHSHGPREPERQVHTQRRQRMLTRSRTPCEASSQTTVNDAPMRTNLRRVADLYPPVRRPAVRIVLATVVVRRDRIRLATTLRGQ